MRLNLTGCRFDVCSRDFEIEVILMFWQITLDDDATEKARHVLEGNSFNKTLESEIKFFHNRNLISIVVRRREGL